jgi:hypothetical protein
VRTRNGQNINSMIACCPRSRFSEHSPVKFEVLIPSSLRSDPACAEHMRVRLAFHDFFPTCGCVQHIHSKIQMFHTFWLPLVKCVEWRLFLTPTKAFLPPASGTTLRDQEGPLVRTNETAAKSSSFRMSTNGTYVSTMPADGCDFRTPKPSSLKRQ